MNDFTFGSLIEDKSNVFAKRICRGFVKNCRINPLWISGYTGCGKTHLLRATLNEVENRTDFGVIYISGEELVESIQLCLKGDKSYLKLYREIDFLFIDDVDILKGLPAMQEKVALFIRDRFLNGRKTALTSAFVSDEDFNVILSALRSLDTMLWVKVTKPVYKTRLRFARYTAKSYDVKVSRNALEFLAHKTETIPQIEGILKTAEFCSNNGDEINLFWMKNRVRLIDKEN